MFCYKCGKEIAEGVRFCTNCGAQVITEGAQASQSQPQAQTADGQGYTYTYTPTSQNQASAIAAQKPDDGRDLAIASLVLGIISIVCCIPLVTGVLSIVFGCIAKSKGNKSGMATAGIVCGAIGIALSIVYFIALLAGAFSGIAV